eukprot:Phypoly_transcript_14883.p1 GENE.Phypoly_transcript_14883~~Phypoly_transcript_14883.p1  ORF type:complete len:218 (+),score=22.84 Phypoly_transcript_14883:306-959(+)
MPLPTADHTQYANFFFAQKAQPLRTLATKQDALKFSTKIPQVCFMGRSNVGKSSLLNALVGIPRLATISATPGCTRNIHLYSVRQQLILADLPGFGHAAVSMKTYDSWLDVVKIYLKKSNVTVAFLLVDSRRGLQQVDYEVMELCAKHNICYQIILTKIDQLRAHEVEELRKKIHHETAHKPMSFPEVLVSSAKVQYGIDLLRARILESCGKEYKPS